eukprot:TRINITY_DN6769_c0_g1_i10.p2 TRINITY_DN6769_c0_g1~~TRINITY_DN6769_c0_g1_i10.p2  ORF type:complete len:205 (+),score=-16.83 TRINITY_DN6769_c0_g1_i10:222-836(+)
MKEIIMQTALQGLVCSLHVDFFFVLAFLSFFLIFTVQIKLAINKQFQYCVRKYYLVFVLENTIWNVEKKCCFVVLIYTNNLLQDPETTRQISKYKNIGLILKNQCKFLMWILHSVLNILGSSQITNLILDQSFIIFCFLHFDKFFCYLNVSCFQSQFSLQIRFPSSTQMDCFIGIVLMMNQLLIFFLLGIFRFQFYYDLYLDYV